MLTPEVRILIELDFLTISIKANTIAKLGDKFEETCVRVGCHSLHPPNVNSNESHVRSLTKAKAPSSGRDEH